MVLELQVLGIRKEEGGKDAHYCPEQDRSKPKFPDSWSSSFHDTELPASIARFLSSTRSFSVTLEILSRYVETTFKIKLGIQYEKYWNLNLHQQLLHLFFTFTKKPHKSFNILLLSWLPFQVSPTTSIHLWSICNWILPFYLSDFSIFQDTFHPEWGSLLHMNICKKYWGWCHIYLNLGLFLCCQYYFVFSLSGEY